MATSLNSKQTDMSRSDVFNLYIRLLKKMLLFFASSSPHFHLIHKTLIVGETTKSSHQKDYVTELLLYTRPPFFLCIVMCKRNKPSFLNHCIWGLFGIIAQLIPNKNTLTLAPSFCGNNIYHKPCQEAFPFYAIF